MISVAKPQILDSEINAVVAVMKSGQLAQGSKVKEFEEMFSKLTSFYSTAVSSGTSALHTILNSIGVTTGDEVITSPMTFVATANSIRMCGATPIFVDISERDFMIDPTKMEEKITPKTKAILPVNFYGQCANYDIINEIAKRCNIYVIEDACQSIGAMQNGKISGNLADGAAFSFYATKNVMCGEGGMITVKNESINEKCRMFRHHGQSSNYEYESLGYNYRMTDLQAAIAIEQMKRLDRIIESRQKNAKLYDELLKDIKGIILPIKNAGNSHVYHQYTIRLTKDYPLGRDGLMEQLENHGIIARVYYAKPLHLHNAFKQFGYKGGDFPIAEKVSEEILSLPVHPLVKEQDIRKVVKVIRNDNFIHKL